MLYFEHKSASKFNKNVYFCQFEFVPNFQFQVQLPGSLFENHYC
jgi:hypothetical protein